MLSLSEFRNEVSLKLYTASKTSKPKELQRPDSTYNFYFKTRCWILDLPKMLKEVVKEVFPSHAGIRELLNIYADRLSWHVLPGEEGMDARDKNRLIIQTRDTERALADQLTELRCHLRCSALKEADRVREATLLVNGFYMHLRLLNILGTLGDQASTIALQKYRDEYERFVTEYRAERKQMCSVTISESRTEVTVQDSGRTFTVQLTKQAPENVDQNELIEMYLKNIIFDCDFLWIAFASVNVSMSKLK